MAATARKPAAATNDQASAPEKESAPVSIVKVATAEVKVEVQEDTTTREVEWRGLTLKVPLEIPPVLMFDMVAMESDDNIVSLMRMFHTLLGADQFTEVRNVIAKESGESQIEAISDLSTVVMESYGTDVGESLASEDSSVSASG